MWHAYIEARGPLSPHTRVEILSRLAHAVAAIRDPEDHHPDASQRRLLPFWKLMPWLKPADAEDEDKFDPGLSPMAVFRKLGGVKKKG